MHAKTAAVLLLLVGFAAAQELGVTLDQARTTVEPFAYRGESLDMKPQTLAYSGAKGYWVLEILSMGQIAVMVPVDAETGEIDTGDAMTDVLKTHYLANFFAKDTAISDFLDSTLSFAQQKQDQFTSAKADLETYKEQLPSNITLSKLAPLESALTTGVSRAEALRAEVVDLQAAIGAVQTPDDVAAVGAAFTSLFTRERDFLGQAKAVATAANAFKTELAGSSLKVEKPELAQAFTGIITTYRLTESVTVMEDTLSQNENTINGFFADLDQKASGFLIKLKARVSQSSDEQRKQAVIEKLNDYFATYQNITAQASGLPADYLASSGIEKDGLELAGILNQSQKDCSGTGYEACFQVEKKYTRIDYLIGALQEDIGSYAPSGGCSGGKELINGKCSCPSGTEEKAGECVSKGSAGLNWTLIGGLVVIIAAIVAYKFISGRRGGEESEETSYDDWRSR